jgi:hypothetical protein
VNVMSCKGLAWSTTKLLLSTRQLRRTMRLAVTASAELHNTKLLGWEV